MLIMFAPFQQHGARIRNCFSLCFMDLAAGAVFSIELSLAWLLLRVAESVAVSRVYRLLALRVAVVVSSICVG